MLNPGGQLPPRTLKAVGVRSCGFALFLGACAITNTPQQDLAYARWAKCNAPYISLEWVDLDGRITFRFSTEGGPASGPAMPRRSWPHGAAASRTRGRPPAVWPVSDQRGRLLVAALGFAGLPRPSYDRALWALRTWLDCWAGIGHVAVGMHRQGFDLSGASRLIRNRAVPGRDIASCTRCREETSHVLQHIDLADPQSSRRLR